MAQHHKSILCLFLFTLSLSNINSSWAIDAPPRQFGESPKETFRVFPVSSEFQIGKILPFIQRAPRGVYLTVGSERGFRAASMMPQITYLIMLDLSEDIVRYNLINKELLKADSRTAYLDLRWHADFDTWQAFAKETEQKHHIKVNLNKDDFTWWQQKVRDIDSMPYQLPEFLNRYHKSPACTDEELPSDERELNLGEIVDYKTGNYLFYDNLYQHLHQLAVDNKIYSAQINLLDKSQVEKLIAYLNKQQVKISVLDLDNLYRQEYIGQDVYGELITKLLPFGQNDSILIVMSNYKDYACGQFQIYIGFTFENVKQWSSNFKMQDFIDSIPLTVNDLINGRLYENNERMPSFKSKDKTTNKN